MVIKPNFRPDAGQLVVITGPSGVGKGTLVKALLTQYSDLFLSISATTRAPRPGEVEGQAYYFLSREQFQRWIADGQLLEWAEYAGNYYGTPRQAVEQHISQGKTVLLEIEVLGARQVKDSYPSARRVFILPPSPQELEHRLRHRGQDSEEAIAKRLAKAQEELAVSHEFDTQIVNDNLDMALQELAHFIWG
jgi:guanylate kinase